MKSSERALFSDLMRGAPFQPATNLWRAIELSVLIEGAFPQLGAAKDILDLGCGDGEVMRILRPHLPQMAMLTGIDVDPAETAAAERSGLYGRVLCCGAEAMPFEDASFDAIISNSVLEHIPPIDATLAQCGRVLKSGGLFVATVPADGFYACLKGAWLPTQSRQAYCKAIDQRLAHERYWSASEWKANLAAASIALESATPYLTRAQTQRWELLSRLTGGLLYTLMGAKKRPIAIQRSLGLREGRCLPKALAAALARVLSIGMNAREDGHACLLIIGRKIMPLV